MSEPLRVTVFDYGAGNLHSLIKALEAPDTVVRVETDGRRAVRDADAFVLPGVGAWAPAAAQLQPALTEIRTAIARGLPALGICLGMQLLFDSSDEGAGDGLGIFSGRVTRLQARCVPQIGWNQLDAGAHPDALLASSNMRMAWFANSFVARPEGNDTDSVIAWTEHEHDRFPSAVRQGRVVGAQFHPEKSSAAGVRFIHAFLDEARVSRYSQQSTTS